MNKIIFFINLASKNWEIIGETEDVNSMASLFTKMINEALDETAPFKTFTNKPNFKASLSTETKSLMSERDKARRELFQHIFIVTLKYKQYTSQSLYSWLFIWE